MEHIPLKKEDMPEDVQKVLSEMQKAIKVLVHIFNFANEGPRKLPNGSMDNIAMNSEGEAILISVRKLSKEELEVYTANNMHVNVDSGLDIKDEVFLTKHNNQN